MRVIMPFTHVESQVIEALNGSGYPWEAVDVRNDNQAYWRLLVELWSAGKTFAIVEHDIVIGPDTLSRFEICPEFWCAAPYPYMGTARPGLGAVCFKAHLMKYYASAALMAGEHDYGPAHGQGHWCTLDQSLTTELQRVGIMRHLHWPEVGHVGSNWPSHGCVRRPYESAITKSL